MQLTDYIFSRGLPKAEVCNKNRIKKNERAIWQRRFWEHTIRDEKDFQQHLSNRLGRRYGR